MDHHTWLNPPVPHNHHLSQTSTGYLDSFCQEGDARHVNPHAHAVNSDEASNYGMPDYGTSNYGTQFHQPRNADKDYSDWQRVTPQTQNYDPSFNSSELNLFSNDFLDLSFGGAGPLSELSSQARPDAVRAPGSSLFHLLNPVQEENKNSSSQGSSSNATPLPYLPMPLLPAGAPNSEESMSHPSPSPPAPMPLALDNTQRNASPPPNPNFFDSEPEEDSVTRHDSTLSALLLQQDDDTHLDRQGLNALRQPPTRTSAVKKLSDAQKATQKIKQAAQQEKREEMISAADAMVKRHRREVQELAQSFGYTGEYLEKLLKTSSHFKGTHRGPQLWNAKLHDKANELEQQGIKVSLSELRQLVRDDDKYLNLSKEEGEELLAQLEASRTQKKKGARLHNKGAALDYRAFIKRHNEEAADLYARTGASIVTFAAPSHVSDTFEPAWVATENAAYFSQESLHTSMWDIARMLQQWAGVKGKPPAISRAKMQSECSAIINAQLKTVSRNEKAKMNYVDYDTSVIIDLGVKLDGWPLPDVVSPFSITERGELRTLVESLRRGSCRWIRLDATAIKEHQKMLDRQGLRAGRKRKERSDKGKTRGSRRSADHNSHIPDDSDIDESSGNSDTAEAQVSDNDEPQASTSRASKKARRAAADITNVNPVKRTTKKANAPQKKRTASRKATSKNSGAPAQRRSRSMLSDTDDDAASHST